MKTKSRFLIFFVTFLAGGLLLLNLPVSAARLSSMSDTVSSHALGGVSNHAITYRSASGIAASATIRLYMADATSDLNSITADDIDIVIAGTSVPVAASPSTSTWGFTTTTATRLITLTSPSSSNLVSASQTVLIRVGTNAVTGGTGTRQIKNSASSGSKYISILSGNDVGLLVVRVGIEDSSGGNITPTIDISATAPAPPTTAGVAAPAPAPAPTPPTQTSPVAPTTETAPTSDTTIVQPTLQPVVSEPKQPATPPPASEPASKPISSPKISEEEQKPPTKIASPPIQEPSPIIPPSVLEQPSNDSSLTAPRTGLPDTLPANAVVQNLSAPVSQVLNFGLPSIGGAFIPSTIRYATGTGGSAEAIFNSKTIPNAQRGAQARISAQSLKNAEFWLGIQIPGRQLSGKLVLGNKAFFISAERLDADTAADVAVTELAEPMDVKFCFIDKELEGINLSTIQVHSFDSIDGIRAEETTWNNTTRCATSRISHLSVFVALADLLPGATPNQIYVLPSEDITKIESEVQTEKLGLENLGTGEGIESFDRKIYATPDTEIALCIPANTFKKPVKKMSLFIEDQKFPLIYDRTRDCYALTIKTPPQYGKQKVVLKIVYFDDQVQVIELETIVTGALQAKLLPRIEKVVRQVQETAIAVNETVKETVETTQPVLQGTVVTAAPIVTIANPAVSASVINWFHYLNHFISSILSFLGLRRRRKPWGAVYDAISKTPIDLAIVRLFEKATQKLIDTQVTDKGGRFSFIAPPGEYYIETRKPPFLFPSKIVTGTIDGDFTNIYHQEPFTISKPDEAITLSIPLDPPNPAEKQGQKMNIIAFLKQLLTKYSKVTLFISLIISALLAFYTPNPLNSTLLGLNCVYVVFQVLVMAKGEKPWGTVFDILTSQPVPLAAISIFDATQKKLLRTRLTDYLGRFNFLAPAGEYLMIASKEHYMFPPSSQTKSRKFKNVYYGGNVKIKKDKALVKINIPMQSVTSAATPASSSSATPPVASPIVTPPAPSSVQPQSTASLPPSPNIISAPLSVDTSKNEKKKL